jgi:hypothetical protein
MAALTLVTMAGCSGGTSAPAQGEPPRTVACDLPWQSMAQVEACRSDDYVEASTQGAEVDVVIASKDPSAIAAALAGAFFDNRDNANQIVVWAYSDAALVGTGYDRGVVSEQGTLGEGLVFQVCTAWDASKGIGETCGEREVFTVTQ